MFRFNLATNLSIFSFFAITTIVVDSSHLRGNNEDVRTYGENQRNLLQAAQPDDPEVDYIDTDTLVISPADDPDPEIDYIDTDILVVSPAEDPDPDVYIFTEAPTQAIYEFTEAPTQAPTMYECPDLPPLTKDDGADTPIIYVIKHVNSGKYLYMKNNDATDCEFDEVSLKKRYRLDAKSTTCFEEAYQYKMPEDISTTEVKYIKNIKRNKFINPKKVDAKDGGYDSRRIVRGQDEEKAWQFHKYTTTTATGIKDCVYKLSALSGGNRQWLDLGTGKEEGQYEPGFIMEGRQDYYNGKDGGDKFKFIPLDEINLPAACN